jgi:hypothetical protein
MGSPLSSTTSGALAPGVILIFAERDSARTPREPFPDRRMIIETPCAAEDGHAMLASRIQIREPLANRRSERPILLSVPLKRSIA